MLLKIRLDCLENMITQNSTKLSISMIGWGVSFLRLSPPTSGLGRRGRRRGAQPLNWTGSLLSRSLAADFWPGQERAAEGGAAGRVVCFLGLLPPTLGLARRGRRRGGLRDRESAFSRWAVITCLAWLALWPSWCHNGGQPSVLRPASSTAHPCSES